MKFFYFHVQLLVMISFAPVALLFGIIVGSFLNVVILRYNTGKGLNGRSECLSCKKKLSWKELFPILSFFIQKKRCVGCDSKLRWQYPLVEIATGILFFLAYVHVEPLLYENFSLFITTLLLTVIIFSVLVVIFVYDLYHTIIPNVFVYIFIFCAALLNFIQFFTAWQNNTTVEIISVLNLVSGALFLIPFFVLWDISEGAWIGLGDGKLAMGIGLLLGFINGISALVLAFWVGAVLSVGYLLYMTIIKKQKRSEITREIPFAPFMIIATLIVYFFPIDILNIGLFL